MGVLFTSGRSHRKCEKSAMPYISCRIAFSTGAVLPFLTMFDDWLNVRSSMTSNAKYVKKFVMLIGRPPLVLMTCRSSSTAFDTRKSYPCSAVQRHSSAAASGYRGHFSSNPTFGAEPLVPNLASPGMFSLVACLEQCNARLEECVPWTFGARRLAPIDEFNSLWGGDR